MIMFKGKRPIRIIAYLLIALGVLTMFYPKLSDLYSAYQQQQLLEVYANQESMESYVQATESYFELNHLFELVELGENLVETSLPPETEETTSPSSAQGILGRLEIEKIKLRLPILSGATQSNLRYAAGHIEGTAALGQAGNAALAAHRSYAYGKLFNRLGELEEGDEVSVISPESTYEYTVHKKLLVDPSDVSVLEAAKDEALLTLITCHPMKNPTHRLIVQAKLVH